MDLNVQELENDVVVFETPVRLSSDASDQLKKYLKDYVEAGKIKIVIDLKDTDYMDSSGLGAIVSKIAVTRSQKGDIRLAAAKSTVANLLELTHIDHIIKIYDTAEQAVKSYQG